MTQTPCQTAPDLRINPAWGASRYLSGTLQDTTNPKFPSDGPTERRGARRLWRVTIVLAIVVIAFAVFAWQQGSDGGDGGPLNAVAEAAAKTQQEPGGRAVMHSLVTVPGQSESFTLTGHMVYDSEDRAQAVIMTPHTATGGPMKMESSAKEPSYTCARISSVRCRATPSG